MLFRSYSVLSDTSAYAKTANYESLSNLPDLDIYVLKDSLENYSTSADLYDTLSAYQKLDSNLTDLVEDGLLSASKIEYGISSSGDSGQTWISDGDGAGVWGDPSSIAADDIIIGDGNKMLWHLPNDLKRLKSITLGNPLIMGRKTFDSIGKPLTGRANIILTNKRNFKDDIDIVIDRLVTGTIDTVRLADSIETGLKHSNSQIIVEFAPSVEPLPTIVLLKLFF